MDETEKPVEKKIADYIRIVKEALIFYTTAFFVLLLIFRFKVVTKFFNIKPKSASTAAVFPSVSWFPLLSVR